MVYVSENSFPIASATIRVYTPARKSIISSVLLVYPLSAVQFAVYGATPPVMLISMAPFPRNVPSSKQVALVIIAVTSIGAVTVTATWKVAPSQPFSVGVTV